MLRLTEIENMFDVKEVKLYDEVVEANLSNRDTDLSAECPHCALGDGFVSTGEHTQHGDDTVRCQGCQGFFYINW